MILGETFWPGRMTPAQINDRSMFTVVAMIPTYPVNR